MEELQNLDATKVAHAPVAQLDRALACGAKGRKFESCQVYHRKDIINNGVFSLIIFLVIIIVLEKWPSG